MKNRSVREYLQNHVAASVVREPEGYLLEADPQAVVVIGADEAGAFYGLQSLRQMIQDDAAHSYVQGVHARDWPAKPFRGLKLASAC